MSRIEEALQKLQKRQKAGVDSPVLVSRPLGTVVSSEHTYGGKAVRFNPEQMRANGLLAPDVEERRLAEQYRVIKRPLLRNAEPDHAPPVPRGNLLMVASALSGEGKTFTCVNLSLSIAREKDWSVVLIDGDCSKPHLSRSFSAEREPGLIDLLRDPTLRFDSLVMSTNIPGLFLLPAGSNDPHASELLASRRMDELCEELAAIKGRMFVFDSSPLLLTTEAAVLGSKVGQVALVVRANDTPRQAVLAALEKLDSGNAVACILNQTYGAGLGFEYGDYYYPT